MNRSQLPGGRLGEGLSHSEHYTVAGANALELYTDASVGKRLASFAVVKRSEILTRVVRQDSIGWTSTCGVMSAELAATAAALEFAQDLLRPQQQVLAFSDNQHALHAIRAANSARTAPALLAKIAHPTTSPTVQEWI